MSEALIPFNEAAAEWTKRTGEESWVAAIYLPDLYETCAKCTAMETHEHPNKPYVTREELEEAVEAKLQSDYETLHDL
jgi:hypothetical protein